MNAIIVNLKRMQIEIEEEEEFGNVSRFTFFLIIIISYMLRFSCIYIIRIL